MVAIDERKVLEAPSQFIVFSKEEVILKLKGIENLQVNPDRYNRSPLLNTWNGQRRTGGTLRGLYQTKITTWANLICSSIICLFSPNFGDNLVLLSICYIFIVSYGIQMYAFNPTIIIVGGAINTSHILHSSFCVEYALTLNMLLIKLHVGGRSDLDYPPTSLL